MPAWDSSRSFSSRGRDKKNQPYLPPEDGSQPFKGGFLTLGLTLFQAFPSSVEDSGAIRNSYPITVAGAVSAFHGLPFPLNTKLNCQRCWALLLH